MNEREKYDQRHTEHMQEKNDFSIVRDITNIPRDFVRHLTDDKIELKADRDAEDDRYDPPPSEDKGGCFLTTACAQHRGLPDDCHELTVLRKFRDTYLSQSPEGRGLISTYYEKAPAVVRAIENSPTANAELEQIYGTVQSVVVEIEAGNHLKALDIYRTMFLNLVC